MYAAEGLLSLAKQLEKLFDQYVIIDGQRVVNPLRDQLTHDLHATGISRQQRLYLSRMASETARDDVLSAPYDSFWHVFRDFATKRLPPLYYGHEETETLFEIVLFGRMTVGNFRALINAPYRPLDVDFLKNPVNAGSFRDFGHFLDYLEAHLLLQLEVELARKVEADIEDVDATIVKRLASIQQNLESRIRVDLNGLEIIGPIDAAQYAALRERRREPALVPVA